jgi:acyl-coenzyme A thioesterase PaaI-like protein
MDNCPDNLHIPPMPTLELPHTPGCLVCGHANPHGLRLSLHVDPATAAVTTTFTPRPEHIGFEGIIHGGVLATVLDEAMVWAATWSGKRFCVAGELTIRYRESARPGDALVVTATIDTARTKLITTRGEIRRPPDDATIATATGKFVPLDDARHRAFVDTLVDAPTTRQAAALLRASSR